MKTAIWNGEEGFEDWHGTDGDTPVNLEAGKPTEISDALAERLTTNFPGLVTIDGKTADKPTPPAPIVPLVELDPAFGTSDFAAWWDGLAPADAIAKAESWGIESTDPDVLAVHPTREAISAIAEHEEANRDRADVLDALEDAYLRAPESNPSDPATAETPATPEPPAATPTIPSVAELLEKPRKELNELAAAQKIESPEKLKDKPAVAKAIIAAIKKASAA